MALLMALILAWNAKAASLQMIDCNYELMGVPFTRIQIHYSVDGKPLHYVTIYTQNKMTQEPFTTDASAKGELLHGWLSKDTENSLELIVFEEMKSKGQSVLINDRMPVGKEMWAKCSFQ